MTGCGHQPLLDGGPHLMTTNRLPRHLTSASLARKLVAGALAGFPIDTIEVAQLLTSEVVTNAVLHTGEGLVLQVDVARRGLRITVEDTSSDVPCRRDAGDEAVDGRGVALVARLSSSWGCDLLPTGKRVWFELLAAKSS